MNIPQSKLHAGQVFRTIIEGKAKVARMALHCGQSQKQCLKVSSHRPQKGQAGESTSCASYRRFCRRTLPARTPLRRPTSSGGNLVPKSARVAPRSMPALLPIHACRPVGRQLPPKGTNGCHHVARASTSYQALQAAAMQSVPVCGSSQTQAKTTQASLYVQIT